MKIRHSRYHWLIAAAVAALALLTLTEVWGQSTGAQAQFEGRPAMGGAQAGTGAAAGPPQGGVGVQEATSETPGVVRIDPRQVPDRTAPHDGLRPPRQDRDSLAKPQRSAREKARKGAKNTRDSARHGVVPPLSEPPVQR